MMYKSIFARSFTEHEQKKMGRGAFIGCLIIAFCICALFNPSLAPLPTRELKFATGINLKMLRNTVEANKPQNLRADVITMESQIICNFTEAASDFCEMHGDIRIHGNSSTIFVPGFNLEDTVTGQNSRGIKPYARKGDEGAMKNVRSFTLSPEMPRCTSNHSVPAIVFSIGGYAGNNFHDFTDVVLPLYLTSRKFKGQVKFLLADKNTWWTTKFKIILEKLSNYEAIDIDKEEGVHCFPSIILGLEKHKELNIDPLKSSHYSMKNFREFLRSSYHLKREYAITLRHGEKKKPRLLIISRKRTRAFMNEQKLVKMAQKLKFDVVLLEADSNLTEFSQVVNSCDLMMGVHGAGLTNLVFLPNNAVFIQVVPLGGLEWLARTDFGDPSKNMNLRYLEYRIEQRESSLIQKYPPEDTVFKDPYLIQKRGWSDFRSVYLDNQNVKLDVRRFRATLVEALRMLRAGVTTRVKSSRIVCHFTEPESDFCEMHGDTRILGNSSTIFLPHLSVADMFTKNNWSRIKPYARKTDEGAMKHVRKFKFSQEMPRCTQNHSVPAVLFYIGGYTENYFHGFSDVVIPLYTTSRKFNGQVQFLLADKNVSWTAKFEVVLKKLSNYEAIDIDKDEGVHCFPSMIIGLKKHKELSIDPLNSPDYSMTNFREFLRSSYYLKREHAIKLGSKGKKRPRLLIISRKRTRTFMNENEIVKMAQKLGFNVVLAEASSNISEFSQLVNSCDVLMGVHGAGLTNIVFLPKNAVLIQVLPFGDFKWIARTFFEDPSKTMNLRSFSQHWKKELRCGAFFGGFILGYLISIYFTPHQGPLPFGADVTTPVKSRIVCNFTEPESDFCEMHGDIRILGNSSTIFIPHFSVADMFTKNNSSGIKPYARKSDEGVLKHVRQFRFSQEMPRCTKNHSVPAVLFSIGEYTGNYFHSFSEVVIPLYTTSRKFNGEVQFLLADKNGSWTKKFQVVLKKLSNYEAIDIDKEDRVHCFPGIIIGLKKHTKLSIDPRI
ncbi:hypothetical protein ACET3Z_014257 [Daucus carota]